MVNKEPMVWRSMTKWQLKQFVSCGKISFRTKNNPKTWKGERWWQKPLTSPETVWNERAHFKTYDSKGIPTYQDTTHTWNDTSWREQKPRQRNKSTGGEHKMSIEKHQKLVPWAVHSCNGMCLYKIEKYSRNTHCRTETGIFWFFNGEFGSDWTLNDAQRVERET